jgi:hypothetical protein
MILVVVVIVLAPLLVVAEISLFMHFSRKR